MKTAGAYSVPLLKLSGSLDSQAWLHCEAAEGPGEESLEKTLSVWDKLVKMTETRM